MGSSRWLGHRPGGIRPAYKFSCLCPPPLEVTGSSNQPRDLGWLAARTAAPPTLPPRPTSLGAGHGLPKGSQLSNMILFCLSRGVYFLKKIWKIQKILLSKNKNYSQKKNQLSFDVFVCVYTYVASKNWNRMCGFLSCIFHFRSNTNVSLFFLFDSWF